MSKYTEFKKLLGLRGKSSSHNLSRAERTCRHLVNPRLKADCIRRNRPSSATRLAISAADEGRRRLLRRRADAQAAKERQQWEFNLHYAPQVWRAAARAGAVRLQSADRRRAAALDAPVVARQRQVSLSCRLGLHSPSVARMGFVAAVRTDQSH